ncbi:hypothetical protein [Anaerovibrio sp.]|uniref:hypothetical protein n=1 Tax=Anaerovibrio sp. TaxID=1872532 RepID=UPI0025F98C1A|nr:hypothetical protein [Anaerovibrio sp.]
MGPYPPHPGMNQSSNRNKGIIIAGVAVAIMLILGLLYYIGSKEEHNDSENFFNTAVAITNTLEENHDDLEEIIGMKEDDLIEITNSLNLNKQFLQQQEADLNMLELTEEDKPYAEKLKKIIGSELRLIDNVLFVLENPTEKTASDKLNEITDLSKNISADIAALNIPGLDCSKAVKIKDIKPHLKEYMDAKIKNAANEKERRELLAATTNHYPLFLKQNPNHPLLEGHMGAGYYLDKSSVKVLNNDSDTPVIEAEIFMVDDAYGGKTTETYRNKMKFKYNTKSVKLYYERNGKWTYLNPNGPMAETRGVKSLGEAAYFVSFGKKFYHGYMDEKFYKCLSLK